MYIALCYVSCCCFHHQRLASLVARAVLELRGSQRVTDSDVDSIVWLLTNAMLPQLAQPCSARRLLNTRRLDIA